MQILFSFRCLREGNQFESLKQSLLLTMEIERNKTADSMPIHVHVPNLDLIEVSNAAFQELLQELRKFRVEEVRTQSALAPLSSLRVKIIDALKPDKTQIRGYTPSKVHHVLLFDSDRKNFQQTRCKSWLKLNDSLYDALYSLPLVNDILFHIFSLSNRLGVCVVVCKHWQAVVYEKLGPRLTIVMSLEKHQIEREAKKRAEQVREEQAARQAQKRTHLTYGDFENYFFRKDYDEYS